MAEGDAGNVIINADAAVTLSNGLISAAVGETANGEGGDIIIRAEDLTLSDRSSISAESNRLLAEAEGDRLQATANNTLRGDAGNIRIVVEDSLVIDNSDITTQSAAFAGGEITIRAGNIRMLGDGDIQTNVQSGTAGGGNITLTADSILAFDDSDILAFAADGRGGNITLDTNAFFGENFDLTSLDADPSTLDGNDRVDINASGAVAGAVTLPDISFIQNSLNDLPETLIDTETLIANSCVVRNEDGSSSFIITGSGGLPSRPGDAAPSPYPTGDVQTVPSDSSQSDSDWQMGDPIIEPQGVYQLPNGELVLGHECI